MNRTRRILLLVGSMLLLTSGCATVGSEPAPSPSLTAEPDASTPAAPPGDGLVIPACADALAVDTARAHLGDDAEVLTPDGTAVEIMPGLAPQEAVAAAEQVELCKWGTPNGDELYVVITELADAPRDKLLAGLQGTIYFEDEIDGALLFWRDRELDQRTASVAHVLDDNAWITVVGDVHVDAVTSIVHAPLEAVRAANP